MSAAVSRAARAAAWFTVIGSLVWVVAGIVGLVLGVLGFFAATMIATGMQVS
ncbi:MULTISPECIES: hypothetical protein [Kocuria]|uniref:hypothetical protein n=1 Tax=Kocuria TaxID=57493 RepID=UPI0034D54482